MNVVDLIKQQVSGGALGELSRELGEPESKVEAATGAAVPTILAALLKLISGQGGADRLGSILDGLSPEILKDPGKALGGSLGSLIPMGMNLLKSLLGGGSLAGLIGLLVKATGLNAEKAQKLLASLLPLVLGTLGGQKKSLGLNAQGLAQMLTEQKSNIEAALPSGLSLTDIPDLGAATQAIQDVGASAGKWLGPLVALAALLALLWFFFGRGPAEEPVDEPVVAGDVLPPAPAPAPAPAPVSGPDAAQLTTDVNGLFSGLTKALETVKDSESAAAAIPQLTELKGKLDLIKAGWEKLADSAKPAVAAAVATGLDALKALVAKVMELPGVKEKLQPVVDGLMEQLATLAG